MSGLPEHEQRAWDAIVADLSGQLDLGSDGRFERVEQRPDEQVDGPDDDPDEVDELDFLDEGYVPPEPPPLPRPRDAVARFSWVAALGGPVVIFATTLLGWDSWITGAAVVASVAGFGSLIARMNDRDDDDNGAVV